MLYSKCSKISVILLSSLILYTSCKEETSKNKPAEISEIKSKVQNPKVVKLMKDFKVPGVGLGFINNGELIRTEYYGEQSSNVPVTSSTMFNVASSTKAITAEVFLRLAAKGEVTGTFELCSP